VTDLVEAQASLEGLLKDEIIRMCQEVADSPDGEFHFFRKSSTQDAAESFGVKAVMMTARKEG